jgi:glycosyltransferase involved in cell wall biosynthesis
MELQAGPMRKAGLLFVMNEIRPGGAEMFVIRLAKFMQADFNIYVYSCFPENDDPDFVAQFQATVPFEFLPHPDEHIPGWRESLYWKLNAIAALFGSEGLYVRLRKRDRVRHFAHALRSRNIRAVNSSASHSDSFAVNFLKRHFGIPAVISMHSAYNKEVWGEEAQWSSFFSMAASILCHADALLYTADHNLDILAHLPSLDHVLVEKVYLGYDPHKVVMTRSDLGWPEDAFVITMMARGIPEKGWEQALDAFVLLRERGVNAQLNLIHTDSAHMEELRSRCARQSDVRFMGFVSDPSALLANSDCTILPSHFPESLPYAITESLAYGTPVFATPIAEIPQMLETSHGMAGGIIPLKEGKADPQILAEQLLRAATDHEHLRQMRTLAGQAFKKFSMEHCGDRYRHVFNKLMHGRP